MATTNIEVPVNEGSEDVRRSWTGDVSVETDASKDVQFQDEDGNNTFINFLMCSANATVHARGYNSSDPIKPYYFAKGGWHEIQLGFIQAAGTTSSAGILVKREL